MNTTAIRIVLVVLLALTVVSIATLSGVLMSRNNRKPRCVPTETTPTDWGTALTNIGSGLNHRAFEEEGVPVIPLHWNRLTKTYDVAMTAGSSEVTAAFDTGSAGMILRTPACVTCKGAKVYTPSHGGAVEDATHTLCRSSISYVSQTNVLQMYSDTVTFKRVLQQDGATPGAAAAALVIADFPIGGMVESYGHHDSVNVLGVSGEKSLNQAQSGASPSFPTSTCRSTATSTYESALLQAVAAATAPNVPLKWSIRFSAERERGGASVALGSAQTHQGPLITVPAVRRLPDAPTDMVGTPWRYYVVEVRGARHASCPGGGGSRGGTELHGFPKHLIIDTATTQFMIPGAISPAKLATHGLVITLNNAEQSELTWPGKTLGSASENKQDYGNGEADTPLFAHMPDAISREFSAAGSSVGILGALAMRGRYIEFTFAPEASTDTETRTISFATA